ncbi:MAG: protein NO VEIN domain-containing protein, partial [Fidelibacterota bacterium]
KYPRCSTDRNTAEKHNLEWVTPGHSLFEAIRRHTLKLAQQPFSKGACYYSLQHEQPARIDFYRARIVDGLGQVVHERLFAVEISTNDRNGNNPEKDYRLVEPSVLGDFTPINPPDQPPEIVKESEPIGWLYTQVLQTFLEETRQERLSEVERIAKHVELSLTELLQRTDEEIGKANEDKEKGVPGADGRLAQAENRHGELLARREMRRAELQRQRSLTLQAVERITSVLILPHPEREAPEVRRIRPNLETEEIAMRVTMEYEEAHGRKVHDVHEKNLGYDLTSLDPDSGELRLIEVKGLAAAAGTILLTPNEQRVAEDRRDCYWLYIVTNCADKPTLQEPVKDPARFDWHEVTKVAHYYLSVDTMTKPMQISEDKLDYKK